MSRLLNLGCGARFVTGRGWTNIDVSPASPEVERADLRRGIPYPDSTFDAVYHSHVLEHIPKAAALFFATETHRVLKPGGVLRVAVPDLEQIAREYLKQLDAATAADAGDAPDAAAAARYDWMLVELLDQHVRERGGGAMGEWLRRDPVPERDYIVGRLGQEAQAIMDASRNPAPPPSRAGRVLRSPFAKLRRALAGFILGSEREALRVGRFRASGELHQWMYDRFGLRRLLEAAGFGDFGVTTATDSRIAEWAGFALDADAAGAVYKPDSLFAEAIRP